MLGRFMSHCPTRGVLFGTHCMIARRIGGFEELPPMVKNPSTVNHWKWLLLSASTGSNQRPMGVWIVITN